MARSLREKVMKPRFQPETERLMKQIRSKIYRLKRLGHLDEMNEFQELYDQFFVMPDSDQIEYMISVFNTRRHWMRVTYSLYRTFIMEELRRVPWFETSGDVRISDEHPFPVVPAWLVLKDNTAHDISIRQDETPPAVVLKTHDEIHPPVVPPFLFLESETETKTGEMEVLKTHIPIESDWVSALVNAEIFIQPIYGKAALGYVEMIRYHACFGRWPDWASNKSRMRKLNKLESEFRSVGLLKDNGTFSLVRTRGPGVVFGPPPDLMAELDMLMQERRHVLNYDSSTAIRWFEAYVKDAQIKSLQDLYLQHFTDTWLPANVSLDGEKLFKKIKIPSNRIDALPIPGYAYYEQIHIDIYGYAFPADASEAQRFARWCKKMKLDQVRFIKGVEDVTANCFTGGFHTMKDRRVTEYMQEKWIRKILEFDDYIGIDPDVRYTLDSVA